MSLPATREELKLYALRRLGAPVLEINSDDEQLEDRIEEAIEKFQEYHHEGVQKVYIEQKVRASEMEIQTPTAADWVGGGVITGTTSGAKANVAQQTDGLKSSGSTIIATGVNRTGTFLDGEEITLDDGTTAELIDTDAVTLHEMDNRYLEVPDLVFGISRLLHMGGGSNSSNNIFDFQYQLRLHDLYNLTSTSMVYYTQVMSHLALIDFELNAKPMTQFNRMQNRVYPVINWHGDVVPGDFLVADAYIGLDPVEFPKVWGHPWLRRYTTELFRLQWGENLYKYRDMQLPGGVSLNGDGIIARAETNIAKLEQELIDEAGPLEFFMG